VINKKNRCWHCGNPLKNPEVKSFCSERCEFNYERAEKIPCLECETILFTGSRKDKKFCDDNCRTDYHNRQKEFDAEETKKIDEALKQNRKILQRLIGDENEIIVTRSKLENFGYDFKYATHTVVSKHKQNVFTFCYNYGYRFIDEQECKIVKAFPERPSKR
jgi:predicted nucleic acid-binding Zn ribbon protein